MQRITSQRDWQASNMLPETGTVRFWAWRTLQSAKDEIRCAVESVMEDLEGLGSACGMGSAVRSRHTGPDSCADDENDSHQLMDDDDDDPSMCVHDMVAPVPLRAEFERELPEPRPRSEHGFELIDYETEFDIITFG